MNKNIFVLEDSEDRKRWFSSVFSDCNITFESRVKSALNLIRNNEYVIIFLDRDLSSEDESGEDVAKEMEAEQLAKNSCVIIHSVNPSGQRNMQKYLESYHQNVLVINFTALMQMKRSNFSF